MPTLPRPRLHLLSSLCNRRSKPIHRQQGNALVVTVGFLASVSALLGITLRVTGTAAHNTRRSTEYVAARSAAEGAVEYAYATWLKRIKGTPISTEAANKDLTPPPFDGVTYAKNGVQLRIDALNEYGVAIPSGSLPPQVTGRVPGYDGWTGRTFTYAAQARVQLDDSSVVGVRRLFQYTEVPLFQSMFFFQDDFEFYRPAKMVINGLIHSNSTMYMATDPNSVTILGNATYTKTYTEKEPPSAKNWSDGYQKNWTPSPPIWSLSKDAQLHQVPAIQPMGAPPEKIFDPKNPNADGFHQLITPPKPNYPDPEEISRRRMINKAGIIIEVNGGSTTITAKNGTAIKNDAGLKLAITPIISKDAYEETVSGTKKKYDAVGIYDKRESVRVDTVNLDIAKLKTALASPDVSGFNNVLYIHDTTASTTQNKNPKSIRLINGSELPPNGLTVASQNPVYIQGDYNTGATGKNVPSNDAPEKSTTLKSPTKADYTRKPAAVIADAVMFLSNSWKDSNSALDLVNRVASNTTYNTAILAGFMPSTPTNYSGGANNFPRFLETWDGYYCTYYGSMVQLFESKTFTGKWNTGVIFKPPVRHWNFDTQFLTKPPPGSVEAVVLSRGPWSTF